MASNLLTKEEQNFIRFVKARDDVMPLPLRDILAWQINPKDLQHKIQSCSTLMNGDKKLDPYQVGICLLRQTIRTDYIDFDVTLLYKLIRNLCPGLKPTQGWGSKPNVNDTKIGDDIERIRVLRNESGHLNSPLISDSVFQRCWTELKIVIERFQKMMLKNGYNTNYKEKLRDIENLDLGNEPREKYKTYLVLEYAYNRLQADDREKPEVVISGNDKVLCGDMAVFEANVVYADPVCWSLTWQRARGHVTERIDISKEKYKRSTERKLVISPVSKDDEWKYQAVLSKNTNGNEQWTLSNEILLQALGDLPCLDVWKVTTEIEDITIHYSVIDKPPKAYKIEWKKNSETLDCKQRRYDGGSLSESFLRIKASTFEDRGKYSCTVTNAVGSISRFVQIDVPYAKIYTEPYAFYGSQTNIDCKLSSCPLPDEAEWQKSVDGIAFHCIDISEPKYYGSSKNIENPSIVIPKVTFDDTQFYRLVLRNKIGEHTSDKVHIRVIGSPPNITTSHETCIQSRSVRLIGKAFLYEKFPTIHTLFWTKNGKKLDTHLSKGKYSEVSIDNPSLTIFDVNQHDAGSYQLTAINEVGSTNSEDIILSVPDVLLAKHEDKNGGYCFPVTINAIPAPIFVQWSIKDKNSVSFEAIDVNDEKYSGTSNSLPSPVLVVKQTDELETCFFQIEVQNFIGSSKSIIPAHISYEDPKPDTKTFRSLSKLYNDQGASVLFAELFDELVERFPNNRFHRLLDLINNSGKVENMGPVKQANCVRDCFRILRDENLFLHEDVIFMQYLLKTTNCDELYRRCYEYAKLQKALCFYEMPSENGFQNVKFHVQGNLKDYNREQIDIIKSTVATLLRCTLQDIRVNGFDHSTSFFVILSINESYFTKLFAMDESDKGKLARLHIDYFIADFRTVYLKRPKERKDELVTALDKKPRKRIEGLKLSKDSKDKDKGIPLPTTKISTSKPHIRKIATPKSLPILKKEKTCSKTDFPSLQIQRNVIHERNINLHKDFISLKNRFESDFAPERCKILQELANVRYGELNKMQRNVRGVRAFSTFGIGMLAAGLLNGPLTFGSVLAYAAVSFGFTMLTFAVDNSVERGNITNITEMKEKLTQAEKSLKDHRKTCCIMQSLLDKLENYTKYTEYTGIWDDKGLSDAYANVFREATFLSGVDSSIKTVQDVSNALDKPQLEPVNVDIMVVNANKIQQVIDILEIENDKLQELFENVPI